MPGGSDRENRSRARRSALFFLGKRMERGKKGQGFFEKEGALFYDDELPTLWFNDDERTATVPILWPDPPGVSADGKEPPPLFESISPTRSTNYHRRTSVNGLDSGSWNHA